MERIVNTHFAIGHTGLRMFLLNIYWLLFTLLGGVLLGVIPATRTVYQILQEDQKESDLTNKGLLKKFFSYYKAAFLSANKLFMPLLITLLVLFVDLRILEFFSFTPFDSGIYIVLRILLLMILTLAQNVFLFSLKYQGIKKVYQASLILLFGKPIYALVNLLIVGVVCSIFYLFPGVMAVFGISLLIYIEVHYFSRVMPVE